MFLESFQQAVAGPIQLLLPSPLHSVGFIICLGIFAEWLAWRMSLPSILPLLVCGLLAGTVFGAIHPDALFGDLLKPIVSLSAAIILYEGGLSLNFKELSLHGPIIKNLLSVATLINWLIVAVAGVYLLDMNIMLAILLGAVMIITGPTAMGPILRHAKLTSKLNSILKWEGIFNGPIGGMLVIIVFDAIQHGELQHTAVLNFYTMGFFIIGVLKFIALGLLVGAIGAIILIQMFRFRFIPDFLHSTTSLAFLFAFFLAANALQKDSGLLAATVMGLLIANQKIITVKHVIEFKENLRLLLISVLFIILSSRLNLNDLALINFKSLLYVLVVMFVARPIGVLIGTRNSSLNFRERLFISLLNPKGIVAASIGAIVALSLVESGYPKAEMIIPMTFFTILITITVYSLTISPVAKMLGLSATSPQGVLIVGCHTWARELARRLTETKHPVVLVDTSAQNVDTAISSGLNALHANILSSSITQDGQLDLTDLGYMLAITPNDEVNSLASVRMAEYFDSDHIYQLQPSKKYGENIRESLADEVRGHILFDTDLTFQVMTQLANHGATIQSTVIRKDNTFETIINSFGDRAYPLFLIDTQNVLHFYHIDEYPKAEDGSELFIMVTPEPA
ncbi:MAG: cation:proton antiporter [Cyanobacteria bacterium HKST-UBA06]|nr:cation:proton antiporter [Cyanobacteria bacterium HKST-UBA06]